MKSVKVRYFAMLREKAGRESETVTGDFACYEDLYKNLSLKYGFGLPGEIIMLAVNDEFCPLESQVIDGASVVFIPPVAGG